MEETSLTERSVALRIGKVKVMKQLMDAIYYKNTEKCCELMSEMNVRQVNHVVRLKYPDYIGYTVTPLIWAVINGCHDIAEILLCHHAKVNRVGTYEDNITLYTTSPLLEAVKSSDCEMVNLLLDRGACVQVGVAGPRSEEEEGGSIQYNTHLIPLNLSLGKSIDIFRSLLNHADVTLEYGPGRHTCLCFALKHYLSNEISADSQYILEVLHHGGRFCSGKGDNFTETGNGVCLHLQTLIWNTIPPLMMVNDSAWSLKYEYYQCLKLVSCSDYVHERSQVYLACQGCVKECRNYLAKALSDDRNDIEKDCISWIVRYSDVPSPLQHICRVAIRNFVQPFSFHQCQQLSLPEKLLKYLVLNEC